MDTWRQRLESKSVLVSDGAWGTELARRGLSGDAPELWNAARPDDVFAIAASYVEAGSDIILTNTFGGSPFKLAKAGLGERVAELNRLGAEISRRAAGERVFVFASIGSTGEFMAPLGTVSDTEMTAAFAKQVTAIAQGGADGFVIESMYDLNEAKAALRAVRDNTDLPAVCSMTFDKGAAGYATMMGVRPEQAAEELTTAGADAVGANCGTGIVDAIEIAKAMRPATALPLWFKPNAGMPEIIDGKTVYKETPESMAERVAALVAAGAAIVGGCCGSTPDHVRALVRKIRSLT